ncbi:MAG: helix-hairpin-helix domain-containing protein [Ignavibacteria bacterium]|nr:helix-hairpin-helix domain-containing protein [Ignavibacteria bacterium]
MKTYAVILGCFFILTAKFLYSQKDTTNNTADTTDLRNSFQQEILLEDLNSEEDESALLDNLENLKRNPFDLNKATLQQLESIPFLNSVTAKNIVDYRNEIKYFKSKRALLKVEGITPELYEKIKIYLIAKQSKKDIMIDETGLKYSVSNVTDKLNLSSRFRSRFLQDLQPKDGYLSGKYEGSRLKMYNQLNVKLEKLDYKIEANITTEKDPGEKNYADFISGYLQLKDYVFIKDAVAGDYVLNFAQGLAVWSLQAFSKGINAVNPIKKKGKGIDGYGSVNEVQFFRGGAAKIALNNFNVNLFYSDNYYDASVNVLTDDVSSFYYDGYHRTSTEIKRKNSAKEKLYGGRITYEKGSLRLGTTYWTSKFSKPVTSDSIKKLSKFSGNTANMIGADYDFIYKNMNFYGEFAHSQTNSIASINAVQFTFFKIADLLFSYRNYPADFAPVHSFGFSEKGETYNERGFYAGIIFRPLKGLIVNGYFDQYKFPYRTFFNPVPTSGNDFLANIEWRAAKGFVFNFKYKNENKEETQTAADESGRAVRRIDNRNQLNVRTGFIYQVTDKFRFRSRYEYVNVGYKNFGVNNKGYLFFSDIRIIPVKGLVFDTRFIFFNTDDYDSRIYEFENDIQGVMSNVALYGEGRRWYLLMKYKPIPFGAISLKYAETYFDGVKSIGSGNDEIEGDVNNRLSMGIEVGF